MKVVIDASVWVSSVKNDEIEYRTSLSLLRQVRLKKMDVVCPSIVKAECASAIRRSTGSVERAGALLAQIEQFSNLRFRDIDETLVQEAIEIIRECALRGYDSIYAALAKREDAILISWDEEFMLRNKSVFQAMRPHQWLADNG